eukprot:2574325-Amphidinium_carterae.1
MVCFAAKSVSRSKHQTVDDVDLKVPRQLADETLWDGGLHRNVSQRKEYKAGHTKVSSCETPACFLNPQPNY